MQAAALQEPASARRLDTGPVLFSINCYVAAMLALLLALLLNLERPYWAVLTVYITAQPLSGEVRSKAVYRLVGTLLGLIAAVALVPPLVDSPELLSLAFAAWIGLCLYVSLLDRTPRSYVFRLAGYTAALIGFPSVMQPSELFQTALARGEEIALGVVCAAVVHSLFFPRAVGPAIRQRVRDLVRDAQRWVAQGLSGEHTPQMESARRHFAPTTTELQLLATHLPYDAADSHLSRRDLQALQDRLVLLLPTLTGAEDRIAALKAAGAALPEELTTLIRDMSAWAAARRSDPDLEGERLLRMCRNLEPVPGPTPSWTELLIFSLTVRLGDLLRTVRDVRELTVYIIDPYSLPSPHVKALEAASRRRPLHIDHGLALLAGFAAAAAVLACCAFWIATAWPDGAVAAVTAGVFASLFATLDDPTPAIRQMFYYVLASLPIAALYEFAILPRIDGLPLLMLALAPFLLVTGFLMGTGKHYARAMPLLIGVIPTLSLTERYTADFSAFINSNVAQLIGALTALTATALLSAIGAEASARRILRLGWRDLADITRRRVPPSLEDWTNRMIDRTELLLPRLSVVRDNEDLRGADPVGDLRIGLCILELRRIMSWVETPGQDAIRAILSRLERYYSDRARGATGRLADDMPLCIDMAIRGVARLQPGTLRRDSLVALTSLRRNLLPDAPAFIAVEPTS